MAGIYDALIGALKSFGINLQPVPDTPPPIKPPPIIPPPPPTSVPFITRGSGGSFADNAGGTWTLSPTGDAMRNSVKVTDGAGTGALTYINKVVYGQDDNTKSWFTWNGNGWDGPIASLPGSTTTPPVTPPVITGNVVSDVLAWLKSFQGKHCILVQHLGGAHNDTTTLDNIHNATGQWPAGIGGSWYNDDGDGVYNPNQVPMLIDWYKKGGVITINNGTPNPSGQGSNVNIEAVLTNGTPENTRWKQIMADSVDALLQLKKGGVNWLFWRPLHEMNGTWEWYGPQAVDNNQYKRLWKMWKDYNDAHGCDHLIYVYASNGADLSRYPGDDYVHVVGYDAYTANPAETANAVQTFTQPNPSVGFAANKSIAYCEFGSNGPDSGDPNFDEMTLVNALKGPLNRCIYVEQWWERWALDTVRNTKAALNDPYIFTRDNINRPH